jgi:hypothetical protein
MAFGGKSRGNGRQRAARNAFGLKSHHRRLRALSGQEQVRRRSNHSQGRQSQFSFDFIGGKW